MNNLLLIKEQENNQKTKISMLQAILTVAYVVALITSNVIGGKQMELLFGVAVTAGGLTFPITYILSDIFSEVYGYKWSRRTCYIAFASNLFVAGFCMLAIKMPPASFYTNQEAYAIVLGNTPRMLFSSLFAYVIGDWANDRVFQKMKAKDGDKKFGLRAILSSVVGELVDSAIFTPLAFAGTMPISGMVSSIITYGIAKCIFEIVLLPVTSYCAKKVNEYER